MELNQSEANLALIFVCPPAKRVKVTDEGGWSCRDLPPSYSSDGAEGSAEEERAVSKSRV